VTSCSLTNKYGRFGGAYGFHPGPIIPSPVPFFLRAANSSTLMMEAACPSETLRIYQITRRHIPEYCCQNLNVRTLSACAMSRTLCRRLLKKQAGLVLSLHAICGRKIWTHIRFFRVLWFSPVITTDQRFTFTRSFIHPPIHSTRNSQHTVLISDMLVPHFGHSETF
jgi:hypothetical protein